MDQKTDEVRVQVTLRDDDARRWMAVRENMSGEFAGELVYPTTREMLCRMLAFAAREATGKEGEQ